MIGFKAYITNQPLPTLIIEQHLLEGISFESDPVNSTKTHTARVAGHHVTIYGYHSRLSDAHHIDFSVDHTYSKPSNDDDNTPTPAAGHAILHHVAHAIHKYKEQYKPKAMVLAGNDSKKSDVYRQFAHHLAKHYGGHVNSVPSYDYPGAFKHTVHFNSD